MTTMTLATAMRAVRRCVDRNIPAFLWGDPGVGKTQGVHQLGSEMSLAVLDYRLLLRETVDLRGIPAEDKKTGTTKWLRPNDLPFIGNDCPDEGILFMDEMNTAAPSVQAVGFGLVQERRVGEHVIKPGWRIIAAGNPVKSRGAAQRMPSPLRNRFAHFHVASDVQEVVAHLVRKGKSPIVVALLRWRPELLHKMPETDEENAFPTPRAWENVCDVIDEQDKELRLHLVSAIVGDGPAAEAEGMIRVWQSITSLDAIIKDPESAGVPSADDPATLYAVATALARAATRKNFAAILTYAKRFPTREFEIVTAIDAVRRDPSLCNTECFGVWAVANQDVTI